MGEWSLDWKSEEENSTGISKSLGLWVHSLLPFLRKFFKQTGGLKTKMPSKIWIDTSQL